MDYLNQYHVFQIKKEKIMKLAYLHVQYDMYFGS